MKAKGNIVFQVMVLLALAATGIAVSCNMGRQSQNDMNNEKTASKKITVIGTAQHAKAAALVETETGEVYYIRGKQSWGELENKKVKVTGKLVTEHYKEEDLIDKNGNHMQGMVGDANWIVDAKAEEVK